MERWREREMRGKMRIFGFAALLSFLLAVPLVFGLGIVDVPKFSFEGSTVEPASSTALVSMDPAENITDYEDATYDVTIDSTVTFLINISDVADLFVWQINVNLENYSSLATPGSRILNFSRIIANEFLANSPNQTSSEALGWVINSTDNTEGYSVFAETILANVSGISGSGDLVSIEFLIVGYGCANITISVVGTLPTTLLDDTGSSIMFTVADSFFKNKLTGDTTSDGYVNALDQGKINGHWAPAGGAPEWSLGYDRCVDNNDDGYINALDQGVVNGNWGRNIFD